MSKPINVAIPQADLNKIQTPDIGRKLVTRYGLREKAPVPTLATEVVPVVLVDDLIGESDLIRPRIRPAAGRAFATGAANTVSCYLQNPANSKTIIHVYYLLISCDVNGVVNWRSHSYAATQADATAQKGFRNGLFAFESPVGIIGGKSPSTDPGGASYGQARITSQNMVLVPWDHVIAENQALTVESNAAITGNLYVTFVWSEEPMER